jgi:hypothetical protein
MEIVLSSSLATYATVPAGLTTIADGDLPSVKGALNIFVGVPLLASIRYAKTPLLVAMYARRLEPDDELLQPDPLTSPMAAHIAPTITFIRKQFIDDLLNDNR